MADITLGQALDSLKWIVAFLGTIGSVIIALKKILATQLKPINEKIESFEKRVNEKIDKLDVNQCRNYLVDFLTDMENGIEKDEVQIKRAYEIYDHYNSDLKCNSYVHDKWEKVMNRGERKWD